MDQYSTNLANFLASRGNTLANLATGRGLALGNINLNTGNTLAQLAQQSGDAKAAGLIGQANSFNNLLGQGMSLIGLSLLA